jgi:hypothetical protein
MLPGMDSCVRFVLRRALIVFEILRDTVASAGRRCALGCEYPRQSAYALGGIPPRVSHLYFLAPLHHRATRVTLRTMKRRPCKSALAAAGATRRRR